MIRVISDRIAILGLGPVSACWKFDDILPKSLYESACRESLNYFLEIARSNMFLRRSLAYTCPMLYRWLHEDIPSKLNKRGRRRATYLVATILAKTLKPQMGSLVTGIRIFGPFENRRTEQGNWFFISDRVPCNFTKESDQECDAVPQSMVRFVETEYSILFDGTTERFFSRTCEAGKTSSSTTSSQNACPIDSDETADPMQQKSCYSYSWGRSTTSLHTEMPSEDDCRSGLWDLVAFSQVRIEKTSFPLDELASELRRFVDFLGPGFSEIQNERIKIRELIASELSNTGKSSIPLVAFACRHAESILRIRAARATPTSLWQMCYNAQPKGLPFLDQRPQRSTRSIPWLEFLVREIPPQEGNAGRGLIAVEAIAPLGVLSSRCDYLAGTDSFSDKFNEHRSPGLPVEIVNTMWLSKKYYALRRHSIASPVVMVGPGMTLLPSVRVIPLSELFLSVTDEDEIALLWGRTRVDPYWRTTLSPRASLMTVLLRYASIRQCEVPIVPHREIPYVPCRTSAMTIGSLQISPEAWSVASSLFRRSEQNNFSWEHYRGLRRELIKRGIPRFVFARSESINRRRPFDLKNPLSLQFLRQFASSETILLERIDHAQEICGETQNEHVMLVQCDCSPCRAF